MANSGRTSNATLVTLMVLVAAVAALLLMSPFAREPKAIDTTTYAGSREVPSKTGGGGDGGQ